jgi:hypothetical protein
MVISEVPTQFRIACECDILVDKRVPGSRMGPVEDVSISGARFGVEKSYGVQGW